MNPSSLTFPNQIEHDDILLTAILGSCEPPALSLQSPKIISPVKLQERRPREKDRPPDSRPVHFLLSIDLDCFRAEWFAAAPLDVGQRRRSQGSEVYG